MSKYTKYPRTFHLPWSEGKTSDDKVLQDTSFFKGKEVVVTEKLDGENTTLYRDHMHARSIDSKDHPSRHWMKMFHAGIQHEIPEGFRLCGENLFAKHSIFYEELTSYFYLFSLWDKKNNCLSWDETVSFAKELGIETAPVLYRGAFDEKHIKSLYTGNSLLGGVQEGYVIRLADGFSYDDFSKAAAKFVRKDHVQTDKHWLTSAIQANKLKNS